MTGPGRYRYAVTAGEFGAAGGQTLIAALLPVLLAPHAPSTFWIGAVIASEGLFALVVPYLSGAISDSLPPRLHIFGPRRTLLALAAPVMATALVLIAFLDGFWPLAAAAVLYFFALHAFSTPLRALFIDVTPESSWGRVQGVLGAFHLGGVGYGLVAGGLLYALWRPLPFLVGAGLVLLLSSVTLRSAHQLERGVREPGREGRSGRAGGADVAQHEEELRFWRGLLRRPEALRFLVANILWNAGTEGIRPFLFLFATVVLGIAVETASLAMLGFLAAAALGSVVVGRMGDRFGRSRLLLFGAIATGLVMIPGYFVRDLPGLIVLLVPAGLGAAALVSLPYPVFEAIAGEDDVGRSTGAFFASVGVARLIAPLLVGAAIDGAEAWLPDEQGYPIMWPVTGGLVLLSAVALQLARRAMPRRVGARDSRD